MQWHASLNAVANFYYVVHLGLQNPVFIYVGGEAANSDDSTWNMDCSTVLRVKTLHISSPILAAKSPFFYKVRWSYFALSWSSFILSFSKSEIVGVIFISLLFCHFCSSSQMG